MALGLNSFAISFAIGARAPLDSGPRISLSANVIDEDAAIDTVVGTLSIANAAGNWLDPITYTLTDDAGGLFKIANDDELQVAAALDYETASGHSITVQADNGTDDPITRSFAINVTDVDESGDAGSPIGLLLILTKAA